MQLFYKFKNYLNKLIEVKENSECSISDPLGLKLLTRLRLNFSHLNNINSGITSEALSTLCALAVLGLKHRITASCGAKILLLSGQISSIEFLQLMFNSEIWMI